ncbi:MAG: hypothetical protein SNF68_02005 [Rikenellaceae bacterium]
MGAFTPFKRNANKFKYVPRYYDPAKEAREQRRTELFGERLDEKYSGEEYRPGQYIKKSRDARSARRAESKSSGKQRMWISIVILLVVFYMGSMLYGKIMQLLDLTEPTESSAVVEEEFNPYTPITIVPNDYVEEAK